MQDLTPSQLESIRRLLVDPLRETIKSEVQLSHDRLAASIRKLTDQLSTHAHSTDARLSTAERDPSTAPSRSTPPTAATSTCRPPASSARTTSPSNSPMTTAT